MNPHDALELLDEPSVEEAHPEADLDLDDLLAEAVEIAEARKALKRRVGSKVDPLLADIVQRADAALVWHPEYAVARFIESHCACGASHRRFDGWFIVSTHRRDASTRRFVRHPDHSGLPSWQYTTTEDVDFCADCVGEFALPAATIDLLTGIDALGAPADCCCDREEQLQIDLGFLDTISLDLDSAEDLAIDDGDTPLEELDND